MDSACECLVVEDDHPTQSLLRTICTRLGLQTVVAEDGAHAIEVLRVNEPHIMLLDLLMPRVDGFEVLDFVRATHPILLKRIIVLTASNDPRFMTRVDEKSIWRFMRKPVDIEELSEEIVACRAASMTANYRHPPLRSVSPLTDRSGRARAK